MAVLLKFCISLLLEKIVQRGQGSFPTITFFWHFPRFDKFRANAPRAAPEGLIPEKIFQHLLLGRGGLF